MVQFEQKTVAQARQGIGRLMFRGKYLSDTVLASPAPTSTTFALALAKRFPDDHFQGYELYCLSGTGSGQAAYCSNSAVGTGIITITPALSTVFDATSVVELWPDQTSPEEVLNAINLALAGIASRCDVYVETSNPTLDSTRQIVTIPSTYTKLCVVKYRDSGGLWRIYRYSHSPEQPAQEQGRDFTVQGRLVYLSEAIPSDAPTSTTLITGYRAPASMVLDTDLLEAPWSYVVFQAAGLLEQGLIGNVDVDPENHQNRAAGWLANAIRERDIAPYTNYLPNTIILDTPGS
jgi:hypothetical protein